MIFKTGPSVKFQTYSITEDQTIVAISTFYLEKTKDIEKGNDYCLYTVNYKQQYGIDIKMKTKVSECFNYLFARKLLQDKKRRYTRIRI